MRILFVTSTRIGDAVLSSGLLGHLLERYPAARLTIACGPAAAPLFEAIPNLETLIRLEKRRRSMHWLELWSRCAGKYWHLIVDLRRTALPYLLPTLRRRRMGPGQPGLHKVQQYARTLGLDAAPPPRVWTTKAHARRAAELVPDGAPVLGLGPTANWRGKEWRAERFAELAKRLTAAGGILPGARLAVFSAPDERERAVKTLPGVAQGQRIDLAGKLDLLTAHACLERCDLFIGNDSGLMHLAAAAGTPTLGLFGPSRPEHYAPWGPKTSFVRTDISYEDIIGAPGYDYRTTQTLMDSLGVDRVEAAAGELWARISRQGKQ
ncbi:MAG: glycosyltransferase family 9 protein [Alphaproteobacteria bacterium]